MKKISDLLACGVATPLVKRGQQILGLAHNPIPHSLDHR